MIPNNQFFFRQTGIPAPQTQYEYVSELMNLTPGFAERDGTVFFQLTNGNGRLIGGWNGSDVPTTNNEQWETSDLITYTQIADAPWDPRHNFCHAYDENGVFYIWAGDDQLVPGVFQKDAWKFTVALGWQNITMDMGSVFGAREGSSFMRHKGYFYSIGGTIQDCVRSTDLITWTKMSNLPVGFTFNQGYGCSHNGDIYIIGGYTNQIKVYKSTTDGASWTALPDLVTGNMPISTAWCRMLSFGTCLLYLVGGGDGGNYHGVYYSEDGALTWTRAYSYPVQARHAPGMNYFGDDIAIVAGNAAPDSNRVYRLPKVELAYKAVYSTRKAVPDYTGPCMRVRRSSDNAQLDIGYVGDDLDTATLLSFAGVGSAFLTIWYEESGMSIPLAQATAANQPIIVLNGVLQTLNGKPAVNFDTNAKKMLPASAVQLGHHYVLSFVASHATANSEILSATPTDPNRYGILYFGSNIYHNTGTSYGGKQFITTSDVVTINTGTQYLTEIYRNRMTAKCFNNGVDLGSTTATFTRYDTDFTFTTVGGEGIPFVGLLQEINLKSGYVNFTEDVAIQADINGYFQIY